MSESCVAKLWIVAVRAIESHHEGASREKRNAQLAIAVYVHDRFGFIEQTPSPRAFESNRCCGFVGEAAIQTPHFRFANETPRPIAIVDPQINRGSVARTDRRIRAWQSAHREGQQRLAPRI